MKEVLTIKKPQVNRKEAAISFYDDIEDVQYIELSPTINKKSVFVFDKARAKELATKTVIVLKPIIEGTGVVVGVGAYVIVETIKLIIGIPFGLLLLFVETLFTKKVGFVDDNFTDCQSNKGKSTVNVETNVNVSGDNVDVNVQTNININ